jgi:hypothetical protein
MRWWWGWRRKEALMWRGSGRKVKWEWRRRRRRI